MAKGGYKGTSPARETSPEEYSGVWDIVEQYDEQNTGSWPFQEDDCAPKGLRFNSSDNSVLSRTPLAESNRRIFTFSCWVKLHKFGSNRQIFGSNSQWFTFYFDTDDRLSIYYERSGSRYWVSNATYRDPSAWYSLVLSVDTTKPTSDKIQAYVNGEEITWSATDDPGQNYEFGINSDNSHDIGMRGAETQLQLDGTIAEAHFIDGQALSCNEFGFFDGAGIWMPKKYTGDYASGTVWSNYLTASNGGFHAAPYNQPAGFNGYVGSNSGGYVQTANGTANPNSLTFTPPVGIPYNDKVEVWLINNANTVSVNGGTAQSIAGTQWVQVATGPGVLTSIKFERPSTNGASFGGIRVDGVDLTDPAVGRNSFHLDFSSGAKDQSGIGNDFTSSGIDFAETESIFSQIKYTGTNNNNPVTGTGFTPDFVWIKRMSSTEAAHSVYSSIRGVTKSFDFDNNTQEKTNDPASFVSFDADGFTVSGTHNQLNSNGSEFAAFSWKAGGSTETSYSASTAAEGSIASYSSAGEYFSIVRWSGTGSAGTVKHGLNKKPKWVVVTPINADDRRRVYHEHMDPTAPHNYHANLDLDQARTSSSTSWNGAFTDKVITLGTDTNTNSTGRDYIAWCWAEQPGKSKFGVYDGSSSDVTIDVGFAPDWVMIKCVGTNGAGQEWIIKSKLYDDDEWLQAERPYAIQSPGRDITWTSTGFTVAPQNGPTNYTGRTLYIYAAFKTTSNIGDECVDTPVNGLEASTGAGGERRGNYATLSPIDTHLTDNGALSNGNLKFVQSSTGARGGRATIGVSSGKYYWEFTHLGGNASHGIAQNTSNLGSYPGGSDANGISWFVGGNIYRNGSTSTYAGKTFAVGDVIGTALDMDAGTLTFYKNGVSQGVAATGLTGTWFPAFGSSNVSVVSFEANFGQRVFKQTPPSGFSPLATSFLPEAPFKRGDEAFDIALWTGNGAAQTVRYPRLKPDLIWLKERTDTSDHGWWNTLSGVTKYLSSNLTDDEFDTTTEMNSLNEDGFTVGASTMTNESSQDYVGWAWQAGEATTTIGAGGSNNLAYDLSQTWSSSLTSTQTFNLATSRAFDGNLSNLAATANATTANILFTKTFTNVTKLRVYMDHDYQNYRVRINGGTWHTDSTLGATANAGWRDLTSIIPANGTVNSIESDTGGQNNGVNWSAVEVNGRLLIDSGTSVTNVPAVECKVRANQAAGFSIIKVDSPTNTEGRVHGLSKTPDLVICKSTASSDSWHTYWKVLGRGYYINLNGSSNKYSSDQFGSQEANEHSFYVKPNTGSGANKAGGMLYFAWHSVEGFSKFGEYTANNRVSGPFIYCGFKPKLVIIWCHNQGEGRNMFDTARHPDNFNGKFIKGGDPNQEPTGNSQSFAIDILSNGFKPRGQWGGINDSNTTAQYLFAAWADEPFQSNCRAR